MTEQTAGPDLNVRPVARDTFSGVVIGLLVGYTDEHCPLVAFPGNPKQTAIAARSTAILVPEDLGKEVALLFEDGDSERPIVIGPIRQPTKVVESTAEEPASAELDGERIVLAAKKEIVLKCGKASITLTEAGKVLIRGAYLLNRSSGVNRIKGGSVQIN